MTSILNVGETIGQCNRMLKNYCTFSRRPKRPIMKLKLGVYTINIMVDASRLHVTRDWQLSLEVEVPT